MKPGWKTTEFYLTVAVQLVAVAVLCGFIKPQDQASLTNALTAAIQNVAALIAAAWTLVAYAKSRAIVKSMAAATLTEVEDKSEKLVGRYLELVDNPGLDDKDLNAFLAQYGDRSEIQEWSKIIAELIAKGQAARQRLAVK